MKERDRERERERERERLQNTNEIPFYINTSCDILEGNAKTKQKFHKSCLLNLTLKSPN